MKHERLLLIRGIPGSGKSTLAKRLIANGEYDAHFETDDYFTDDSGRYRFVAENIQEAVQRCFSNTEYALKSGKRVIVSNTFTRVWEMQSYIELARQLNIEVSIITCTNTFQNVHDCPEEKVQQMKDRFEYDISELFE